MSSKTDLQNEEMETQHENLVANLAKPGVEICNIMRPNRADLLHGAIGVCTEAGELLDAVKRQVIYDKPLDIDNVIEELGDLEFYLRMVRRNLNLSRAAILAANIEKLGKRYKSGKYSDEQAQARADKEESSDDS